MNNDEHIICSKKALNFYRINIALYFSHFVGLFVVTSFPGLWHAKAICTSVFFLSFFVCLFVFSDFG